MIKLRKVAVAAAAVFALGALAAPASAASAPAATTTHAASPSGSGATSASTVPSKATASPNDAIVGAGNVYQTSDDWCHFTGWGGNFFCNSQSAYGIPGQLYQVFVIGTDDHVWTKWSGTSGIIGWESLGGTCTTGAYSTHEFEGPSPWEFATECIGANGDYWANRRNVDGSWSDWFEIGFARV